MRTMTIKKNETDTGVSLESLGGTLMHVVEEGTDIEVNALWGAGKMAPVVLSANPTYASFKLEIIVDGTTWTDADARTSTIVSKLVQCELVISDLDYNIVGFLDSYDIERNGTTGVSVTATIKGRKLLPREEVEISTRGEYEALGNAKVPVVFSAKVTAINSNDTVLAFNLTDYETYSVNYQINLDTSDDIGTYIIDGENGRVVVIDSDGNEKSVIDKFNVMVVEADDVKNEFSLPSIDPNRETNVQGYCDGGTKEWAKMSYRGRYI